MRDRELYAQILGITSPWKVEDVELTSEEVRVRIRNERKKLPCPECGKACGRYDSRPRQWRHLDTCQLRTVLIAKVPRISCPTHGVRQVEVPWAEEGSGFTALFEALVIDWLREASCMAVARRLGVSWRGIDTIMQRAVRRGLARREPRLPQHIGVDETSYQKRHEYVTVVSDQGQEAAKVVYVSDHRREESLGEFLSSFEPEDLEAVESVTMDMWQPYINAVKAWIPDAEKKIAFDRFHIAKHLGDAVDQVRRQENKALLRHGDESLKGTRYLWLKNHPDSDWKSWGTIELLRTVAVRTSRAWAIKEFCAELWNYKTRGWARRAWLRWYSWAIRSRLEPVKKAARMIKSHLGGILNAVVLRKTNARAEGINSRIQWIKATACGYRNRLRFRSAIYFHLGGLDLYPKGVRS